jgi:outer membrane receptor protein involved in Fe transport
LTARDINTARAARLRQATMAALILLLAPPLWAAAVQGRVQDAGGRAVAAATVTVSAGGRTSQSSTDGNGRFSIPVDVDGEVTVSVDAPGFRTGRKRVFSAEPFTITLVSVASATEEVTVTATLHPQRVADTPASVAVLSSAALEATSALALDDALRQVPGFTLFRRTSSRTANPTTQGASLRGVGGSGAGRAAVLEDGVSLADPFGGWIYWTRVPRVAVERIEVLRGGASDLYGGGALSGVVQVVRRGTERSHFDAELSAGSDQLGDLSLSAGGRKGGWGLRVGGAVSSTSGYVAVPQTLRGAVDEPLSSVHYSFDLQLERHESWGRVFLRGARFHEHRENGTVVQQNETDIDQGVAGLDARLGSGTLTLRGDLLSEAYDQTFSAIAADRASERKTSAQHVPSRGGGVSARFSQPLGANHVLLFGVERRGVRGVSHEDNFAVNNVVTKARSGGRQRATGFFVEDLWTPWHRLTLTAALRHDRWRNFEGERASGTTVTALTDRAEHAWSPRGTALLRFSDHFALTSSLYRSFRPPTLNELYRSFRVGNVLTGANAALEAERLKGREVGALVSTSPFSLRATYFSMDVEDTVANVTLSTTPALITRERRNLGGVRSRGLELEAELRLSETFTLSGAWMTTNARVTSAPGDPALVGLRVPQVPRRQGSVQLRRSKRGGFSFGVQGRFSGEQKEDDLNRLSLKGYQLVDVLLERPLTRDVGFFAAVENVANQRIEIARTPILTIGPARSFRLGLRVRMGDGEAAAY